MIVNQFNTHWSGGAAIAARRLHEALPAAGVTSRFWCANLPETQAGGSYGDWRDLKDSPTLWRYIRNRLRRKWRKRQHFVDSSKYLLNRPEGLEIFSTPQSYDACPFDPMRAEGDILHLHWIAGLLDMPSFFRAIPDDYPIVWTLHDMNPFTGGCHFSSGCEAFQSACQCCPQLSRPEAGDLSQRAFQIKQRAYQGKNLNIVTPSQWLEGAARRSRLFADAKTFQTIPNGLDTELFCPHDRSSARQELDLPAQGTVLLFGCESVTNRRKGIRELIAALSLLQTKQPVIGVIFGGGALESTNSRLSELRHLGYVSDPRRQAILYSAADLVVVPSVEDNLPNVGLEAMACGTPVVGFDIGGIPDFARPGQTGLLAKPGDSADLARQIDWLVDHPQERRGMGQNARQLVEREFSQTTQARAYAALYQRLVEEHRPTKAGKQAA